MLNRREWNTVGVPAPLEDLRPVVDVVRAGFVLGWVAHADQLDECSVHVNGDEVAASVRTIARTDLTDSRGDSAVGFIVRFEADPARRPRRAVLNLRAGARSGRVLVECRKEDWRRTLIGSVERVSEKFVTGWLVDPGAVRSRRRATLLVNDVPVCVVEATDDRPDVQEQFGVEGPTGFMVELPRRCRADDVVALVDPSGAELDRLVVSHDEVEEDDERVANPIGLPGELLSRYRHDLNGDFLLIRGPGFRVMREQGGPVAAPSSKAQLSSRLTHQLDHIAMTRPPEEPVGGWLDELDRAVAEVGHRYRRGWLLLGDSDLERATAADDAHLLRGRPSLTAWQRARLARADHRLPVTDDELALYLTNVAVDLRQIGDGLSLMPDEQIAWLGDLVDPWHPLPVTRYIAARRSVVPHWRDSFAADDEISRAGLLCEAFADEMCNGFGWTFFGALALMPEVVDSLTAAVLTFAEGGWPETTPRFGDGDVAAYRGSLEADHPLSIRSALPVDSSPARPHHALIGLIGHGSAVGHNATLSERALAELGLEGPIVSLDHSSHEVGSELIHAGAAPSSWVLLHSQPDYLPSIMANGWPYLGRAGSVIGYMAWESTAVPQSLHPGIGMVDEIWTPSEFSAAGLRTATSRDVHVVPHAFLPEEAAALLAQQPAGEEDGTFRVLAIADAHSGLSRKNISGMLKAFDCAFGGDPAFRLILRIRNFLHITVRAGEGDAQSIDVLARISASRNVEVVSGEMGRAEILALYERAHCYLSLHRSEGFGYTMAEAMMAGVPVVATGYSGNLEYMSEENALLVDYDVTSIRPGEYLFWAPGMQWAEPSIDHAATLLRSVASDRAGSRARAERARADVADRLSFDRLVGRFKELLDGR
jgi:glycosyltransferase involved in cell wall biosynthesis